MLVAKIRFLAKFFVCLGMGARGHFPSKGHFDIFSGVNARDVFFHDATSTPCTVQRTRGIEVDPCCCISPSLSTLLNHHDVIERISKRVVP